MVVIFTGPRLTSCSTSCQRRMTCCVLFPSLLRRARRIPAVPPRCASTNLSLSPTTHCSWMSCRTNSESWRRRTWLCDPRYTPLRACALCAGCERSRVQNPSGFLLKHMAILCHCVHIISEHFPPMPTSFCFLHSSLSPEFSSSLFSVQL